MLRLTNGIVTISGREVARIREIASSRPFIIEGLDGTYWHDTTDLAMAELWITVHADEMLRARRPFPAEPS